ncbi:hypothetical protein L7F22_046451 [Adiantum nelumboides]|nr:hypothetical protein [Adiantum nelumboides]
MAELSQILFTESRDFLFNKEGAPVIADAIAGKVVGLIIGPFWLPAPLEHTISLIKEPYAELHDRPIQLVYVAVERDEDLISTIKMYGQTSQLDERPDHECFADVLKKLPDGCLAVPLEDGATQQGLALIEKWGAEGYPFDHNRIMELQKGVEEKRANQTLQILLVHEGQDDLISSKDSKKVKVATLEGKIVALYFSAHWCPPCQKFTPVLASIYEQLRAKGEDFELVFISSDESQESFTEYFGQMPWLAVPYEDEKTRKHLSNWFEVEGIPTLIILDKQGKTLNMEGMELVYKYGIEAYPFTLERLEELKHAEEAKRASQTLGSLLVTDERDFVNSKFEPVKVDSLEGKTVGLYFSGHWCPPCRKFTPKLKAVYDELKGRGEQFEVIFVSSDRDKESFEEYYESMPWLALPFNDKAIRSLSQYFDIEGIPQLVIIGPNGKTITKDGRGLIGLYGVDAFPFTDDRLVEVKASINKKYHGYPKQATTEKHGHTLTLTDDAYGGQVYVCDDCDEQGFGWVYHCAECGYDLHPECTDVKIEAEDNGHASKGEGAKPGYICEGDVCRKV